MARSGCSTSKISVWWDFENCHIPRNVDPHYIAHNLKSVFHHANLNGPITIDMFGDTRILEDKTLEALSSTGVTINHIPRGNKDAADKAILVAMLFWALDNPPPAHFLLISGDGGFANALHRLRLKGYDILLARPDQPVAPALLGAATSVWYWTNVAEGQIPVSSEVKKTDEESNGRFHRQHNPPWSSVSEGANDKIVHKLNASSSVPQYSKCAEKLASSEVPKFHQAMTEKNFCFLDERQPSNRERDISPTISVYPKVLDLQDNLEGFDVATVQSKLKLQAEAVPKANLVPDIISSSSAKEVKISSSKQSRNLGHGTKKAIGCGHKKCASFNCRIHRVVYVDYFGKIHFHTSPVGIPLQDSEAGQEKCDLSKPSYEGHQMPLDFSDKIAYSMEGPLATCLPVPSLEKTSSSSSSQHASQSYKPTLQKVLETLETLKLDGLLPTLGNLQDCLCYWDKQHAKVNLKQVLDRAVDLKQIEKVSLKGDANFTFYLPCNTQLWNCFDVGDMLHAFSDELWMEFHQFLCCGKNWQFIVHSQSMYEAAQHLKNNGHIGIRNLAVGEIIGLLNQAVWEKKWLSLENSPTFAISIRLEAVTKQNLSDGVLSPNSRALEVEKGSFPSVACNKGTAKVSSLYDTSTKLMIFQKLRTWLLEASQMKPDYDVSRVRADFECATGIHLDPKKLGYAKLHELINEFDDVVTIKVVRKGLKILCPVTQEKRFKRLPTFGTAKNSQ